MSVESLSWVLVFLSLLGNVFVIKKNVVGQWMWAVSNLGWIGFDIYMEAYSQAFLFAVYFGMCVWGIIAWSKQTAPEQS
jgi:hypothetical protein